MIGDAVAAPPVAVISAPDVTSSGSSEAVTVTYSGNAPIDPATIATSNITVTPYNGGTPLYVSLVDFTADAGGSITAVYTVDAPGGTWTATANGSYVITVQAGSVLDTTAGGALGVGAAAGSFRVNIDDTTAPTAAILTPAVTAAGGGTYTFNVTYTDDVAIDVSTITAANVAISGPVGPLRITGFSTTPTTNASQVIATYTAVAPNGAWDIIDNGLYTITLNSNQVFDTAQNPVAFQTANFSVAIPVPDTTPPTATIDAPDITAPGGASETVTVTYTDETALQPSTIDANDLAVTGPDGTPLAVTLG